MLRRHGALWPPNFAVTLRIMDLARDGVLLIGDSGDEVFGIKQITPLAKVLAARNRAIPACTPTPCGRSPGYAAPANRFSSPLPAKLVARARRGAAGRKGRRRRGGILPALRVQRLAGNGPAVRASML